jgi:hypothetical protein
MCTNHDFNWSLSKAHVTIAILTSMSIYIYTHYVFILVNMNCVYTYIGREQRVPSTCAHLSNGQLGLVLMASLLAGMSA